MASGSSKSLRGNQIYNILEEYESQIVVIRKLKSNLIVVVVVQVM
jgi:hypothetical protein